MESININYDKGGISIGQTSLISDQQLKSDGSLMIDHAEGEGLTYPNRVGEKIAFLFELNYKIIPEG